jgi:hypothetical protein
MPWGPAWLISPSCTDNAKKKEPVLDIVITLFKVYFHLNTLQLCKNLINAVERLDFNAFPAASRVTYMFYMGRLSIFNNDYVRTLPPPLSPQTESHNLLLYIGQSVNSLRLAHDLLKEF